MSEEKKEEGAATPSIEELFQIVRGHNFALQGISQHLMDVSGRVNELESILELMLSPEGSSEEEGSSPQADGH